MMKPSETGSLINYLIASIQSEPKVGDGATILGWTDRTPGTIVKVTRCQIHVQEDRWTRTDKNGIGDVQDYIYERNPEGSIRIFRKTKRGWRWHGRGLRIGERERYYDFNF